MQKEKFPHVLRQNIREPFHENWQSFSWQQYSRHFFQGVITNSTEGRKEGRGTNDLQKMSNEKIIWQGETASPIFNPVIPIPPFSLCPIEQLGVS